MSQPQPVRAGDVYPASADHHEARRERDKVIGQGQEEQRGGGGGLHVTETDLPAGKRMVTASAGGQVRYYTITPFAVAYWWSILTFVLVLGTPLSLCR
jgi:hypothetical protein